MHYFCSERAVIASRLWTRFSELTTRESSGLWLPEEMECSAFRL